MTPAYPPFPREAAEMVTGKGPVKMPSTRSPLPWVPHDTRPTLLLPPGRTARSTSPLPPL